MEEGETPWPTILEDKILNQRDTTKEHNRLKKLVREKLKWYSDREKLAISKTKAERRKWDQAKKEVSQKKTAKERRRLTERQKKATDDKMKMLSQSQSMATAVSDTPGASDIADSDVNLSEVGFAEEEGDTSQLTKETPGESDGSDEGESEVVKKRSTISRRKSSDIFMLSPPTRTRSKKTISGNEELVKLIGAINERLRAIEETQVSIETWMHKRHDVRSKFY